MGREGTLGPAGFSGLSDLTKLIDCPVVPVVSCGGVARRLLSSRLCSSGSLSFSGNRDSSSSRRGEVAVGNHSLCRRFHFRMSGKRVLLHVSGCVINYVTNASHGHVRRTYSGSVMLIGNSPIGDGCHIGPRSVVAVMLSCPGGRIAVIPRSVPVSVICRSRCVVLMGGRPGLIIRPKFKGFSNALLGTMT